MRAHPMFLAHDATIQCRSYRPCAKSIAASAAAIRFSPLEPNRPAACTPWHHSIRRRGSVCAPCPCGEYRGYPHDVPARRSHSRRATERSGLRRLYPSGRGLPAASDVHGVRLRRLRRLIPEQARSRAFSCNAASDRALDRAGRGMGLVLHRPALVRKARASLKLLTRRARHVALIVPTAQAS
jgi:hypothetical protein